MLSTESSNNWSHYPMGPQLRRYLGITEAEYSGHQTEHANEEELGRFQHYLESLVVQRAPSDQTEFVDLLEELTAMGMSSVAVKVADIHSHFSITGDFRACLSLGSSLMMESELDEAIALLQQAKALAPMEVAPYINLSAIYFSLERDTEALQWADSGLQIDANNSRLWEIIASIYLYEDKSLAGTRVRSKAEQFQAYAGYSLAAELLDPNDKLLKSQLLEEAYNNGIRDDDFLIEYTAALGLAQQFEKIPQLVWRLEHMEKKTVHWKLFVHAAQAYLALEQGEQAQLMMKRAAQLPDVSAAILNDLNRVYEEQSVH